MKFLYLKIVCSIVTLVLVFSCVSMPTIAEQICLGDVNCDYVVDSADVLAIRKFLVGKKTLTSKSRTNADVDVNGDINLLDMLYIRKFLINEITFDQIKSDTNLLDNISNATVEAEYLGNPAASQYSNASKAHYYARNPWDMVTIDGKVLISNGNYTDNTGNVPIFYYQNSSTTYKRSTHSNGTGLSSEEIKRFIKIDGEIYAVATDPLGMNHGTYYWYNSASNKWQHYDTLTYGIHVYDMVEYDGKVFFGGMFRHSSASEWITSCVQYLDKSDLRGTKMSTTVKFYYQDGTEFYSQPYTYNGKTYYDHDYYRSYDLFVFKNELYAIHCSSASLTKNSTSGLFKYDKKNDKFVMVYDGKAIKGANAVVRHKSFTSQSDENGYYVEGGVLCYFSFEDNSYTRGGLKYGNEVVYSEPMIQAEFSTDDTYVAVCNGIFKSTDVEKSSGAFEEVSLGAGNEKFVVRDAFELDGKYYFLASQMNSASSYTTAVFQTDSEFSKFTKVLSFETPAFALSFSYNAGYLYVGLGTNYSYNYTGSAGKIYRIDLQDYVK